MCIELYFQAEQKNEIMNIMNIQTLYYMVKYVHLVI